MNLQDIMSGISRADLNQPAIRCIRIFELSTDLFGSLQAECLRFCRSQRPSNVTDPSHVTNWVRPKGSVLQFSLLNGTGRYDDTSTDHDESCQGKHFSDAAAYPVLGRFLSEFPHCINFRLNVLGPSASLSPHKEHVCFRAKSGAIGLRLRFHLPIVTNAGSEIILDGQVYRFPEKQVVLLNQGCVHAARNKGTADRIHLVWDMLLTEATAELMFGDSPAPFPAARYRSAEQTPSAVATESAGNFMSIDPLVHRSEVSSVQLIEPQ